MSVYDVLDTVIVLIVIAAIIESQIQLVYKEEEQETGAKDKRATLLTSLVNFLPTATTSNSNDT